MTTVGIVDQELTRELRRSVLRPNLSLEDELPGDERPGAVHLAALDDDGQPLCACIVFEDPSPWRPAEPAWHLRQMATAPDARGAGHGREVLAAAVGHVRAQGATVLWCDARESAAGFYERCGWHRHGEVFTDADHPTPHVRMWIATGATGEAPDDGPTAAASRPFGFAGALLLVAGLLPALIAFTSGVWFTAIPVTIGDKLYLAPVRRDFDQVLALLDGSTGSSPLASAYFGWLAWTLLAVVFVLALPAITPHRRQGLFRVAAPAVAAASVVLATLSLELVRGGDFTFWWKLHGSGYWLAVAGLGVMGLGAALGPVGGRRLHDALGVSPLPRAGESPVGDGSGR